MKAISLDSWSANGIRYSFEQEYEITQELLDRFPHKWKVTSEIKTSVVQPIEFVESKPVEIPVKKKRHKK